MCDGSFEDIDSPFSIGGEVFQQLWMLADGIHPPLSRFVKLISVPLGETEALFSLWQESKCKDVKPIFGVFKKKFHFLESLLHLHLLRTFLNALY
jgi:hypothetical protein